MKKIVITWCVFVSKLVLLLLPVLFLWHGNMNMGHSGALCFQHCFESIEYFSEPSNSVGMSVEKYMSPKIVFEIQVIFVLSLVSIYFLYILGPPIWYRNIKSYAYYLLGGIVFSNT